jgi:hypothetical protein
MCRARCKVATVFPAPLEWKKRFRVQQNRHKRAVIALRERAVPFGTS